MTPKLYTLEDVDPDWSQRWRLGAEMSLPVGDVFLHHTVTVPSSDVLGDAAKVNDIDQGRFGKISYSWNVHALTGDWIEAETTHRGAHTINNANQSLNGISLGIGIIGNFQPDVPGVRTITPSDAMIESIAEGIDAFVRPHLTDDFRLRCHRDVYATACDGDLLYARTDDIRALLGHAPGDPPPIQQPPPPPPWEVDAVKFHYAEDTQSRLWAVNIATRPVRVHNFLDADYAVAKEGHSLYVPEGAVEIGPDDVGQKRQGQKLDSKGMALYGIT